MSSTFASPTRSGPLTREQADDYHADGFLVLRGVFEGDEVGALSAEAERLLQRTDLVDSENIRCRWQNHAETGECRFDWFDPVIDLSALCESVARDPRIVDVVSMLYGEEAHHAEFKTWLQDRYAEYGKVNTFFC